MLCAYTSKEMTVDNVGCRFTRRHERHRYLPRYALVREEVGYEFLVDTHKLYGLSLITVRRGRNSCIVWVDEAVVEIEASDFGERDIAKIRELAQKNKDELQMWFMEIRSDWKRDRLERNCLID
jgi:hypothetical protein